MAHVAANPGRPIEVGLHLLLGDIPHADVLTTWPKTREVVQRIEELGFDAITVGDHLLMDFSDAGFTFGMWECFTALTALAASTSRVQLGTLVAATAYRNPGLLAKMAATIDEVSGGRLELGLGSGWYEHEFHVFGFPSDHLVSRFEEAIEIITRLLRGERVTYQGTYYQVNDCEVRPLGPQAGGIPIMIGAKGSHMMALAARYADILDVDSDLVPELADPTPLRARLDSLDAACREIGRDPASIRRTAWFRVDMPGRGRPEDHPLAAARASWPSAKGSPKELAELFRAYAAEGFSRVQVWLDPCTVAGVEAFAEVLDLLDAPYATNALQ